MVIVTGVQFYYFFCCAACTAGGGPTLNDFQERFDKIIAGYNKEKDKNTIEATFEALMRLTAEM